MHPSRPVHARAFIAGALYTAQMTVDQLIYISSKAKIPHEDMENAIAILLDHQLISIDVSGIVSINEPSPVEPLQLPIVPDRKPGHSTIAVTVGKQPRHLYWREVDGKLLLQFTYTPKP